jgi:polysaccharide pyruvyl transferase WcaK-like protein
MKINIVGWYGMKNVGDEAFRDVFEQMLKGHELMFVTPPNPCPPSDITILGGGAVTSPFYLDILSRDRPLYAVGVDMAYESEIELIARMPFRSIYNRNTTDLPTMKSRLPFTAETIPDLAFYLEPSGKTILKAIKKHKDRKTIGVFATDYVNPAIDRPVEKFAKRAYSFHQNLARELDRLYGVGYEIVLVPCSTGGYGDDRRINLDIKAHMKYEPTVVDTGMKPQAMIDLIAELDCAICMRFHSHIFAMIAGTPFVSIDFTRKVKLLLEENDRLKLRCAWFDKDGTFVASQIGSSVKNVIDSDEPEKLRLIQAANKAKLTELERTIRREWLQESA